MQRQAVGHSKAQGELRLPLQHRLTILLSAGNQFGNDL
jgi:hypothetical protein